MIQNMVLGTVDKPPILSVKLEDVLTSLESHGEPKASEPEMER